MDSANKDKIEHAAHAHTAYLLENSEDYAESSNECSLAFKRITPLYVGLPQQTTEFLSTAQALLAVTASHFNDRIGRHLWAKDSRILITLHKVLKNFTQVIEVEAGCTLRTKPASLKKQIEYDQKFLQQSYGSNIPEGTPEYNIYLLQNSPVFFLDPPLQIPDQVTKGGLIANPRLMDHEMTSHRKLYNVFISSTFEDMADVRKAVLEQLQHTEDYNPIGMEQFAATDESQLDYIRDRMEVTDLYVLILGGRYGTLLSDNSISYTHKEYRMAQAMPNIKVLAFICKDPEHLPYSSYEQDPDKLERLNNFRDEVKNDRLAQFWNAGESPKDIAYMIYEALNQQDKSGLQGWVRGQEPKKAQDHILRDAELELLDAATSIDGHGKVFVPQYRNSGFVRMKFSGKIGVPKLLQMLQPSIQAPINTDQAKLDLDLDISSHIDAKDFHMALWCWRDLLTRLTTHKLVQITPAKDEIAETTVITEVGTEFIRRHPEKTVDLAWNPNALMGEEEL